MAVKEKKNANKAKVKAKKEVNVELEKEVEVKVEKVKVEKEKKKSPSKEKKPVTKKESKIKQWFKGVGSEFKKVRWPNKKEMIKYSIATIVFILFFALFFYLIEVIMYFINQVK